MNDRVPDVLRASAEVKFADELTALATADAHERPPGWSLSPRAVRTFICGSHDAPVGDRVITRKFYGDDALVERAVVTLAGSRGLMLVGEPGTAKSMLSELLAAAISGTSAHVIQGTAATTEEQIRYSWNYALLLAEGPTPRALVPSPLHDGMTRGHVVRFEEITRCPPEVQDVLVSVLSEKVLAIPEFEDAAAMVPARPGFNVIATANVRDRGVHEMSAALKRRFNFETVRPIGDVAAEVELVQREASEELAASGVTLTIDPDVVTVLVTAFQDLRAGATDDGVPIDRPTTVMSTAEAVSVCLSAGLDAWHYGDRELTPAHLARHLAGAVFKDQAEDLDKLKHYFQTVVRKRAGTGRRGAAWKAFYAARRELP